MIPARVKGIGKLMLSINGIDEPPVIINGPYRRGRGNDMAAVD